MVTAGRDATSSGIPPPRARSSTRPRPGASPSPSRSRCSRAVCASRRGPASSRVGRRSSVTRRCVETTRRSEWRASRASPRRRSWRPRDCCGSVAPWLTSTGQGSSSTPTRRKRSARSHCCMRSPEASMRPAATSVRPGHPSTTWARSRCCPRASSKRRSDGRSVRSGSHGMAGYSPPTSTAPSWTARPTVFSAWSASVATCWCPRPARRPPAPRLHGLTSSCGPICF